MIGYHSRAGSSANPLSHTMTGSASYVKINDQFAEEAFTVYDHPKVFIFHKTDKYDLVKARAILGAVDYTQAIHVTPKRAGSHPANLMLPSDRWAEQRDGGTWSELFNINALQDRFPGFGAVIWYLGLTVLGWVAYPLLRVALPGLADKGYPMARAFGLLLLSYLVWVAGSYRIPFSRLTISLAFGLVRRRIAGAQHSCFDQFFRGALDGRSDGSVF